MGSWPANCRRQLDGGEQRKDPQVSSGAKGVPYLYRCWIEGVFTGLGYAAGLAAISVFLVGSFRPQDLPMPYWTDLRWLRTDTFGFGCFIVAVVSMCASEFLRLSRKGLPENQAETPRPGPLHTLVLAGARTLAVAGTVLVAYLSVNSVTHPITLLLQATHLLSFPTESTLRVVGLIIVACAVAIARSLRISVSGGRPVT
jgi:hypothetical protein